MKTNKWHKIPDSKVRCVWEQHCDCDIQHDAEDGLKSNQLAITPNDMSDIGTPICQECGDDYCYVRTEICKK